MHMVDVVKHKVKVSSKGLIVTPLDENRILLERVPKLSEFFCFLRDVEASKILLMERKREVRAEMERREEL